MPFTSLREGIPEPIVTKRGGAPPSAGTVRVSQEIFCEDRTKILGDRENQYED